MTDSNQQQDPKNTNKQLSDAYNIFSTQMEALRQERLKVLSDLEDELKNEEDK